jgi:hypothetical protein
MLNAHPSEGETPSFKGSMLIYTVEKEEEAWELIRNDIYVKSGVWDVDAAQVIPVCPLFPHAMILCYSVYLVADGDGYV